MSSLNNGSDPAFPCPDASEADFGTPGVYPGLSTRDYMAIHSTQPGVSEIVKAAELMYDPQIGQVIRRPGVCLGTFNTWWEMHTLAQQCELSAKVRYAQADAMLKVRTS